MSHLPKKDFDEIVRLAEEYYSKKTVSSRVDYIACYITYSCKYKKKSNAYDPAISAFNYAKNIADKLDENENRLVIFKNNFIQKLQQDFIVEDPVFLVVNKINQRINQLHSLRNLFMRSSRKKIKALSALRDVLLKETEGTVGNVIDDWNAIYQDVIRQPRNRLVKKHSNTQTETARFITELKEKYGSFSYGRNCT